MAKSEEKKKEKSGKDPPNKRGGGDCGFLPALCAASQNCDSTSSAVCIHMQHDARWGGDSWGCAGLSICPSSWVLVSRLRTHTLELNRQRENAAKSTSVCSSPGAPPALQPLPAPRFSWGLVSMWMDCIHIIDMCVGEREWRPSRGSAHGLSSRFRRRFRKRTRCRRRSNSGNKMGSCPRRRKHIRPSVHPGGCMSIEQQTSAPSHVMHMHFCWGSLRCGPGSPACIPTDLRGRLYIYLHTGLRTNGCAGDLEIEISAPLVVFL